METEADRAEREARRRLRAIALVLGLALQSFVILLGVGCFGTVKQARIRDVEHAVNNARQIGLALDGFRKKYGRHPDESTFREVKLREGHEWQPSAATSNDLLQQLFISGHAESERMFFTTQKGVHAPDDRHATQAETLAAGECGFAYIPGATSKSHPLRPVALAPMIPGTLKFDPAPYGGRAVILHADLSVMIYRINRSGTAIGLGGGDLFDPSRFVWGGEAPVVKWQKPGASVPWWERWRLLLPVDLVGFLVLMEVVAIFLIRYGRKGSDRVEWRP